MDHVFTYDAGTVIEVMQNVPDDVIDWGLQTIKAPEVWDRTKGKGVKVAILDTGIDQNHPDLKPNIKAVADFASSPYGVRDLQGHGTHVAGIIAGIDNQIGMIGVAPEAELYIAKVLGDNGSGSVNAIVQGIQWAIQHGVHVINMSLGCGSEPPLQMHAAIQEAARHGIIVVAATGNENSRVCWPAQYDETIAVSAIDQNLKRASFSNYGIKNEIAAPGVDIYSTYKNGSYAKLSGTSMATPVITGSIALYLSRKLALQQAFPTEVEMHAVLSQAVTDLGIQGKDEYYGAGLINLTKLIDF